MELFKGERKMYELIFILYISYIILAYIKEFDENGEGFKTSYLADFYTFLKPRKY